MKQTIPFLLAAGIFPLATTAMAQDFSDHLYLSSDIGASFQEKVRIRGAEPIDFHNGVRGDIAVGYRFNSWIAAEFATGTIWNSGDKIGGVAISSFSGSMDLYQIPIMGNAVFSIPAWHGLKPYAGAGLGGVAGMLDFQRPLGNIRDTDFTFSYQLFAGLNYRISRHIEVGVGYKFLETDDHNWEENGVTLKTEGTANHSLTASFIWSF